jgi:dienelactone hydrolase
MKETLFFLLFGLFQINAFAALHTETVEYKQGDQVLEGYLAYNDNSNEKRPGIMVVHEWMGLNDYAKKRAEQLAELGYVAFAADIYGKGIRPANFLEANKQSSIYKKDRALLRERAKAGLKILEDHALVDKSNLAAIGYCFGGLTVLELARSGADVKGVVSFHGSLGTPTPQDAKNIKGKVLVLHGADDPFSPAKEVAEFEDEMRKAKVDWQVVLYGGAVHSFTNPESGNDPGKGAAYHEAADKRSWEAMKMFFREIFA